MTFSKEGSYLAYSAGVQNYLWDVKSGKELPRPGGADWSFGVAAFAPDGKSVAGTTLGGGKLRLWSLTDDAETRTLEKVEGRVIGLAFPERERLLAVTTDGKSATTWDALRGKRLSEPIALGAVPVPLVISPDGQRLAFDAGNGVVSVRSAADGKELHRLAGHTENVYWLAFSADGGSLAVTSYDTTVRVWDVTTGKERGKCETPGSQALAVLSPDGKTAATGGPNHAHAVLLWDVATGRRRDDFGGHTGPISAITFSPDGKRVATCSWLRGESEIRLWDAASGRLLSEFTAHKGGVYPVLFSPDGKQLVSGGRGDRTVRVWDAATPRELRALTGHEAGVTCLAISPDGKRLASGDSYYNRMGQYEGRVRLWDLTSGGQVQLLVGHPGAVQAIAFDPRGTTLLVAANGVHTYSVASGTALAEPLEPTSRVWSLSVSPDGRTLLTAAGHDPVQLWERATGEAILSLRLGWCVRAALSPDGRFIAVGTGDGVRLFDRADGAQCLALRGTRGTVGALAFSPDGRVLAAGGTEDTSVLLWDVAELARRPLPDTKRLDGETPERCWEDLKRANAAFAERAAWGLVARPGEAVPLLKESLRPAKDSGMKPVARLIADLDDDTFETRERATRELESLGEAAEGPLREALRNKPTAEQRKRMEHLLARLKEKPRDGDQLRAARAIVVLERIASPEARQVLEALAGGAPDAGLTQDARAALERLDKRKGSGNRK
jgi:WD40 repeat protein